MWTGFSYQILIGRIVINEIIQPMWPPHSAVVTEPVYFYLPAIYLTSDSIPLSILSSARCNVNKTRLIMWRCDKSLDVCVECSRPVPVCLLYWQMHLFSRLISACTALVVMSLIRVFGTVILLSFAGYDLIVDALFGFSFKPPVREMFVPVISMLKTTKTPVVSIDVPSGTYCLCVKFWFHPFSPSSSRFQTLILLYSKGCVAFQLSFMYLDGCWILNLSVIVFPCYRLACGGGLLWWHSARHAHLAYRSEKMRQELPRTIPLSGRPLHTQGYGWEIQAKVTRVPWNVVLLTAELNHTYVAYYYC